MDQGNTKNFRKEESMKRKTRLQNYLLGAASAFDLFPSRSPRMEKILKRSTMDSVREDWRAVGRDLQTAMNHIDLNGKKQSTR